MKKYFEIDKDMIMLQDNTNTDILYKKTEAARPEPHGNQQIRTPDPHETPAPTVGDGNIS